MSPCLGLIGFLSHGSCTIQPTSFAFSSEELLDMATRCGLNRLNQVPNLLSHHLRNSKTNPGLLRALVQLDEVLYGGLALGREEEAWALQNGINLRVGGVSAIISWDLLTKLYSVSLGALKPAVCWCRLVERARMRPC